MKKETEEEILAKFIHLYATSIRRLYQEECKDKFPNYNTENPDFIIKFKNRLIGFELVELIPNQQRFLFQEDPGIKNNAHLRNKNRDYPLLFEVPDLLPVVLEKINEKIQKSKNYVTAENWLLAYSTCPNSLLMLQSLIDDNILNQSINYIYQKIPDWKSYSKVLLYQDSGNSLIIELDIATKKYFLIS